MNYSSNDCIYGRQFNLLMMKRRRMIQILSLLILDAKLSQHLMLQENIDSVYI